MTSDLELLQSYQRDGSEESFTALVNRHLNLVYSAALRQVRSPHLAEEVVQSVFSDLARKAPNLAPDTILTAWLYQVTRRTAIDVLLRQWRLDKLNRWLEEMPEEKIPELQFVPEQRWIERLNRPLVTDDDYRSATAMLRADAETKFVPMAFQALKQYAKANQGQFPTDVSQLQPFFESPIDPAMLQRYQIVPAKSLVSTLAETGGDWLITQKAPINRTFDGRYAIGLTSFRTTVGEGRWDTNP